MTADTVCAIAMTAFDRGGVSTIDAMQVPQKRRARAALVPGGARAGIRRVAFLVLVVGCLAALAGPAFAGLSATGEQAFYPCTDCHPVTLNAAGEPTKPLPNGMEKHEIELQVHDILGEGGEACLACHDDPSRNPGMLILPDGSLVDITGDVSRVCQRCHFEKYRDFQVGIHGNHREKCSASGCHNPHSPSWIYVEALPPFQGTGFEVNAVGSDREPFKPFPGPPVQPPVYTPTWMWVGLVLGLLVLIGSVAYLTLGRSKK